MRQSGGGEHDRAAEHGRQAWVLAEGKKHPYRAEHNVEQADKARLGGGDELGALHEEDEGEADRGQAEHEQDAEVVEPERRRGEFAGRRVPEPSAPSALTAIIDALGWRRCSTIMPAKASVISADSAWPRSRPEPRPLATMTTMPASATARRRGSRADTARD